MQRKFLRGLPELGTTPCHAGLDAQALYVKPITRTRKHKLIHRPDITPNSSPYAGLTGAEQPDITCTDQDIAQAIANTELARHRPYGSAIRRFSS